MKYHFDLAEKRSSQGFEKLQKLLDQGYKLQEEYNDQFEIEHLKEILIGCRLFFKMDKE